MIGHGVFDTVPGKQSLKLDFPDIPRSRLTANTVGDTNAALYAHIPLIPLALH